MTRSLYRCLVRLHPPAFRREFADDMICLFDDASAQQSGIALLFDALLSLLRQWLFSGGWKLLAASFIGAMQVLFLFPLGNHVARGPEQPAAQLALAPADMAFSQALLLVFVLLLGLIGLLGVLRARTASRH